MCAKNVTLRILYMNRRKVLLNLRQFCWSCLCLKLYGVVKMLIHPYQNTMGMSKYKLTQSSTYIVQEKLTKARPQWPTFSFKFPPTSAHMYIDTYVHTSLILTNKRQNDFPLRLGWVGEDIVVVVVVCGVRFRGYRHFLSLSLCKYIYVSDNTLKMSVCEM